MRENFPQYLSAPYQLLWFESDELGIIMVMFTMAMVVGTWFWWSSIIAGPIAYAAIKKRYPKGFLMHAFYFAGLLRLRHYPGFFEKSFLE